MSTPVAVAATARIEAHFARSIDAAQRFFEAQADAVAGACRPMAERFDRGATLLVLGSGAQASDAQHVAVEFVHPVLVGKRALPALALITDAAVLTAGGRGVAGALETIGVPDDIALALCAGAPDAAVARALAGARRRGLLTMLLSGGNAHIDADLAFRVSSADPLVVQEVHETLYHVLWELVHLFLADDAEMHPYLAADPDASADALRQAEASTRQKCRDVCALRIAVLRRHGGGMAAAAAAMAERFARGGRLLAFGNGGSATDAQDAAAECIAPPDPFWPPLPALAFPNDTAVVTAIANDVGFEHVFARQVAAFGRQQDVALGISTSGTSKNVLAGLQAAKRRGLLTVALAGYDGGPMAAPGAADFCFVAPSDYIPRIQEAHATIWHALLNGLHAGLGASGGHP